MTSLADRLADKLPDIGLRWATIDDVDTLVELYAEFFAQSHYQPTLTFSPELARSYLTNVISREYSPHILAFDKDRDDKVVGTISFHLDDTFSDPPLAVLDEVYALADYRRSQVGRMLVTAMLDFVKGAGALCMHIPITSGHEAQQSLVNLFKKFGAEEIGTVLRKAL